MKSASRGREQCRLGQPLAVGRLDDSAPRVEPRDDDSAVDHAAQVVAGHVVLDGVVPRHCPVVLVGDRHLAGEPPQRDDHAVGGGHPDVRDGATVDHAQLAELEVAADEVLLVCEDLVEVLCAGCGSVHVLFPDLSVGEGWNYFWQVLTCIRVVHRIQAIIYYSTFLQKAQC